MKIVTEDLLNSILDSLEQIDYVKTEDIPSIDLYMDQVTTFMDTKMKSSARHPEEDKILTKTMINNYAKNNLLPPPVKKKYTKEHMLLLIFIYYFKGILSIGDISKLLEPLTGRFFQEKEGLGLRDIYNEVFSLEKDEVERMKKDVTEKFQRAEKTFSNAPEDSGEFLRQFSFICMLSFDVYVKKQIIEKMIDNMGKSNAEGQPSGKKGTREKNKEKERD